MLTRQVQELGAGNRSKALRREVEAKGISLAVHIRKSWLREEDKIPRDKNIEQKRAKYAALWGALLFEEWAIEKESENETEKDQSKRRQGGVMSWHQSKGRRKTTVMVSDGGVCGETNGLRGQTLTDDTRERSFTQMWSLGSDFGILGSNGRQFCPGRGSMNVPSQKLEVDMVTENIPEQWHCREYSFFFFFWHIFALSNFLGRMCIILIMREKQTKN